MAAGEFGTIRKDGHMAWKAATAIWEKLELKMERRTENVVSNGTSVQKGLDSQALKESSTVERCQVGSLRPQLGFRLEYQTLVKF